MKQIRVKLSPEAEEVYKYINARTPASKLERMILNAVNKKIELIKANPHYVLVPLLSNFYFYFFKIPG